MSLKRVITIDGLAVNGKTTLAKMLSKSLGFKYFDSGAVYRCIALYIIENNLNIDNLEEILPIIRTIKVDFKDNEVYLNDKNVSEYIRTEKISYYSTKWATIIKIKEIVREIQRKFITDFDTIMEGRDIAARIAPNADVKFYLYSDFETRVKRLWKMNKTIPIEEIRNNILIRDNLDINDGNYIKPDDAIEIDTTNLSIEELYDQMMKEIKNRITL